MKEKKDDELVRDGKKVQLAGFEVYPVFSGFVLFVVPAWLFILVPSLLISQFTKFVLGKTSQKRIEAGSIEDKILQNPIMLSSDASSRDLDLVVYGATGFTGRLVTSYVAKNYGKKLKWAIAGRRRDALEKIREDLGPEAKDLPIVLADSEDVESLNKMVRRSRVIVSTVGPFALHGSSLVAACAAHGTHYCDTTGEAHWVRSMIALYDQLARKSGSRIVHFCGNDCIPWDLSVLAISQELRRRGDTLAEVRCFDEFRVELSGGTIATALYALDRAPTAIHSKTPRLPFDPLLLLPPTSAPTAPIGGALAAASGAPVASASRSSARLLGLPAYSREAGGWTWFSVMAPVNAACVKRSQALLAYAPAGTAPLVYREAAVFPSVMASVVQVLRFAVVITAALIPPVRRLLYWTGALPTQGQGPSAEAMDRGYLRVTTVGRGAGGKQARGVLYFPTDPGYRDTARMVAESGLLLALEPQRAAARGGGVLTPAAGLGEALLERLVATGCSWRVE